MIFYAIHTFGCKVNQYEGQQIAQLCDNLGLKKADNCQNAQVVIVHSCCVTSLASAKCRQAINRTKKLSPNAAIILTGCLPKANLPELHNLGNIRLVGNIHNLNKEISEIVTHPEFYIKTKTEHKINEKRDLPQLEPLKSFTGHTRAFLKVQDGCDGFCSYCIVPYVRKNIWSKPLTDAVAEAQHLVSSGHKEIVLSGIHLGAYGRSSVIRKGWDEKDRLAELVKTVAQVPGLERLRLSSLEPAELSDALLDVIASYKNIMPHLHLSLQSGSDTVLESMNRKYSIGDFLKVVEKAKSRLDRPAITTDIIAGFPTETDENFEQTMNIIGRVGFSRIHVFPYSMRKGTAAEKFGDTVSAAVKRERVNQIKQLGSELARKFAARFIGERVTVLVEDEKNRTGLCERYYTMRVLGRPVQKGQIITGTIQPDGWSIL